MNRCAIVLLLSGFCAAAMCEDSFFHEQVVPILQRRCVGCHSDGDSKGDFSVQSGDLALNSGFIEPGDVQNSRFIEVITPIDGKAEMPKGKDPITSAEIEVLTRWVAAGANWPSDVSVEEEAISDFDWWSLRQLEKPKIPSIEGSESFLIRTPVDAFVLKKLQEKGLRPSSEADRRTLVRRLYFDLIGLPPSPKQVRQFVQDKREDAYERLVDELLDSKHYGERWARHWLDVVHYADTHGYDKDKLRPNAWPYRDYVIRSFNEDKPYSQFIEEQIAGDILWPYLKDGITATGFIAAGPWDFIGHAEVPESKIDGRIARHLDRDDMVTSTMNTFASTTVQCARCHNHKFDPITQEHYYGLQTVFAALDRADRVYDSDPNVAQKRETLVARQRTLTKQKENLQAKIKELGGEGLADFDNQLRELKKQRNSENASPAFGYHSQFSDKQDTEKWVQVDLGTETSIRKITLFGAHDDFGGIGPGFGFPLRYRVEVSKVADFTRSVQVVRSLTDEDVPNPGVAAQTLELSEVVKARYVRVTATKLFDRKGTFIFALGEMEVHSTEGNEAKGAKVASLDSIEAPQRWQKKNLVDGYHYGGGNAELDQQIADLESKRREFLSAKIPSDTSEQLTTTIERLADCSESLAGLPPGDKVYAGTIHFGSGAFKGTGDSGGKPRTIHVLNRGDILQPRQIATPGRIPLAEDDRWGFALSEDHSEGDRRVALAKWLSSKDNPLTWRSIANRVWQYHFGRGIVDTPNDFGRMGAEPTHPELLDWLAVEFRDNGQSLKALHRIIVNSSVYRQQSTHHEANAEIDSGNQFYWRMNRRRLSAEEVRDSVLLVSGKLNQKMFGPGARLFELERAEHSPHYEYHKHDPNDPASHRRSVYRFIVRSQPDPFMTTLDCADSSQSVAKRIETVTPQQALSLMNNKFMLAMSEHFAKRVSDNSKVKKQVRTAFQIATARAPSKKQLNELTNYAKEFGLSNTCRLLFNLNEFVFVD